VVNRGTGPELVLRGSVAIGPLSCSPGGIRLVAGVAIPKVILGGLAAVLALRRSLRRLGTPGVRLVAGVAIPKVILGGLAAVLALRRSSRRLGGFLRHAFSLVHPVTGKRHPYKRQTFHKGPFSIH
jgi:hypothetical protein